MSTEASVQPSSEQLSSLGAPLLAACWAEAGFGAKRPSVSGARWPKEVECSYIDCVGDACTKRSLWVKLYSGGKGTTMPNGLFARLITQPLSLAAIVGMVTLGVSVFADAAEPASTVLLSLVGGRELGFYIFVAAVFAHVSEAAYCYWVLQSLRQPLGACLAWAFLVSLVGWPVTRRVVQLKRVQLKVA